MEKKSIIVSKEFKMIALCFSVNVKNKFNKHIYIFSDVVNSPLIVLGDINIQPHPDITPFSLLTNLTL